VAHILLAIIILFGSILLSWIDIKEHRIYNSHLLLFSVPLLIESRSLPIRSTMIAIAVTLLLTISLRIGGGDFKLFSLLLISQGQLVFSREYFEILTLCIFASLLLTTLHALRRNLRLGGSIPLAPAILAPFTVIYLDI
jgi:Flp pilus assembly protein protease CpaA